MNPSRKRVTEAFYRSLRWLLILQLGLMVVLVFGNVVLRYAFNDGIMVSEELSRFLFMWTTFIGSVLALRERAHLGMKGLLGVTGPRMRRALRALGDAITVACAALFTVGAWQETVAGMSNLAPVTGLPLGVVYAAAVFCGAGIVALQGHALWRVVTGRMPDDELAADSTTPD